VLAGRFAGKKAVVVKSYDEGSNDKKFPHALGESTIDEMLMLGLGPWPRFPPGWPTVILSVHPQCAASSRRPAR
jgi:hypothetical protein